MLTPKPIPPLRKPLPTQPPKERSKRVVQLSTPTLKPFVEHHLSKWGTCSACSLHESASRHVFYRGYVPADILFLGEAPGNSEDTVGRPLVGPAGNVLDEVFSSLEEYHQRTYRRKMLWCVTQTVCCRPPVVGKAIRPPKASEADACSARLHQFIQLVQPKLVVLMGKVAARIWSVMNTDFLTKFPPNTEWPSWAQTDFDIQAVPVLQEAGAPKSTLASLSEKLKQNRELRAAGEIYTPDTVETVHPAWILRQEEADRPTEIKRIVLAITAKLQEKPLY